jgi:hypothetical protein
LVSDVIVSDISVFGHFALSLTTKPNMKLIWFVSNMICILRVVFNCDLTVYGLIFMTLNQSKHKKMSETEFLTHTVEKG